MNYSCKENCYLDSSVSQLNSQLNSVSQLFTSLYKYILVTFLCTFSGMSLFDAQSCVITLHLSDAPSNLQALNRGGLRMRQELHEHWLGGSCEVGSIVQRQSKGIFLRTTDLSVKEWFLPLTAERVQSGGPREKLECGTYHANMTCFLSQSISKGSTEKLLETYRQLKKERHMHKTFIYRGPTAIFHCDSDCKWQL